MGKALESLIIYAVIGLFVVGGGMFFMFYTSEDFDAPLNETLSEEEFAAYEAEQSAVNVSRVGDPLANATNSSQVVESLSWKRSTVKKLMKFMGLSVSDDKQDSQREGVALFYMTKNLVLIVIFVFGSILLAIGAVIFISQQFNKGRDF